jgi:hypothetical protein
MQDREIDKILIIKKESYLEVLKKHTNFKIGAVDLTIKQICNVY